MRGRVRDARGRAPLRGRGRERDRPEGRRVERAGQGPQRRRRPARPAAGARVGSRRPDQGDPPPHHQPAALQGRARAHLRRGPGWSSRTRPSRPASTRPSPRRSSTSPARATWASTRPTPSATRPEPLHPDGEHDGGAASRSTTRRATWSWGRPAGLSGPGDCASGRRRDRAVRPAGQPLGAEPVLERRQHALRRGLQDLQPGNGGLAALRVQHRPSSPTTRTTACGRRLLRRDQRVPRPAYAFDRAKMLAAGPAP